MYARYPVIPLLPTDAVRFRRGEVSIEMLNNGCMLLVYANHCRQSVGKNGRILNGDNARANIFGQLLSSDGTAVGEEFRIISCPEDIMNVMSPAVRRLRDRSLGMAYSWRKTTAEARRMWIRSWDEGKTWSDPVVIGEGGYVTGCHDRLLVMKSGRILAPLHVSDDWDKHYLHVEVAYSDDLGVSWKRSNKIELPSVSWPDGRSFTESGCIEPGVCELPDGRIIVILRTGMGSIFYAVSYDSGTTFSEPHNLEVVSPCAPSYITTLDNGRVLLVWNDEYCPTQPLGGGRHRLTLCTSSFELSFPKEHRLCLIQDNEHIIDYPCVKVLTDEIWVLFRYHEKEQLGGSIASYLMKIPMRDICE